MTAGPTGSTGYCGGTCCLGDCEYDSSSRAFFCCTPGTTLSTSMYLPHVFNTRLTLVCRILSMESRPENASRITVWTRPVRLQVHRGLPVTAATNAARLPLMCAPSTGTTAPTPAAVRLLTCMLDGARASIPCALMLDVFNCPTAVPGQSGAARFRTVCVHCTTSTCTFSDGCSADSARSAALSRLHSFMSLNAHFVTLHDSC